MKGEKSVLIVGLSTQMELAVIQSLGRHGIKVYGINDKKSRCFFSKYLTKGYIFPNYEDEKNFIAFVEQILKKHEINYIISMWPETLLITLNKYRNRFEKNSKLLFPPEEILDKALDKNKTMKLARGLNIPVPKTVVVSDSSDLDSCKDLKFPVVMKPGSRNYRNPVDAEMDFKREYFQNFFSLQNFVNRFKPFKFHPVLVQEFCNGEEIGFPVLMHNGKCVACMQYRILRTYPVNGGVSTYREAVPVDSKIKDYSIKLLKAMNWEGIAEIDYKFDNKNKEVKLLEVNGRFWGAVALSIKSGLDFPYLLFKCAEGSIENKEYTLYRIGTKCRMLCSDTAWLSDILFERIPSSEIGDIPSKNKAVLEYIKSFHPSVKYDFESLDDPLPGILDIISAMISIFSGVPLPFNVSLRKHKEI
ncbi:MAG: hypothetical protein DRN24_02185 [Thermoplasmata archaeon]|nr:MAG: hypothetical protein DRN24_02185 [Thermoplasmata archaeon]